MPNTPSISMFWDAAAASFDDEADHGLRDSSVRAAWAARLAEWVPSSARVLDLGCGTGSLSLLLAEQGHRPVGVDLSPQMVAEAGRKLTAAGFDVPLLVGDASAPPAPARSFDVVLGRHLLWTLPDPAAALSTWVGLLRPGGRLVLIEGRWGSPADSADSADSAEEDVEPGRYPTSGLPWFAGVTARTLADTVRPLVSRLRVEPLDDPDLWGRPIDDERYALVADL